jgi:ribose 5-phosphate isomerase A
VAIVTGGAHGLGRRIAGALAGRGFAVVVAYLRDQPAAEGAIDEILAAGGSALAVRADVTDELDVERLFDETAAAFGAVDVIVHAAAPGAGVVHRQAAVRLRPGGAIVTVASAEPVAALTDLVALLERRRRPPPDRRPWAAMSDVEERKRAAAEASAELVEPGMRVGLGSGSTVAHLLPALAARAVPRVRYVATSTQTAAHARALGLPVEEFDGAAALDRLDLAIDGADQVDRRWWTVKGGGGAHTREKVVAAAAERFVVIVTAEKLVDAIGPPVPLELLAFGLAATLRALPGAELRPGAARTPDDGILADHRGDFGDPAALAARLEATPGVVDHGLFPPAMVSAVLVGEATGVVSVPRPD